MVPCKGEERVARADGVAYADENRMLTLEPGFGRGDATLVASGGEAGVQALVDTFYRIMSEDPTYATIRGWHPEDLTDSRRNLSDFLIVWMGGVRRNSRPVNIPLVHAHLRVSEKEREQWLRCMAQAMIAEDLPLDLQSYLNKHFAIPAERIRSLCERHRGEA